MNQNANPSLSHNTKWFVWEFIKKSPPYNPSFTLIPLINYPHNHHILSAKMVIAQIPEVILSSGHKIPSIGMGTFAIPLPPPHQLTSIFVDAIEAGYRHFDSAAIYGSEEPLGKAILEALERGLIKNRDELFITSKLWCTDAERHLVLPALKKTLEKLGLEYLDLYLIHWPARMKQGTGGFNFSKEDFLDFDIKGTWEAMEECCNLGLAKTIGVSNYAIKKLSQLLQHATIPPAVNQVEMNPAWQQGKLRNFCKEKGIHVTAWSPLGANGAYWGSLSVMENPILKDIATVKGKSVPQVALRWIYEQGVIVVVKSFNKGRMKENLQLFDWELSEDELDMIKQIPQRRGYSGEAFVSQGEPVEQLWDGDQ